MSKKRKKNKRGKLNSSSKKKINKVAEQTQVLQYVRKNYNGMILQDDMTVLKRYELDIYLPQKKLAIEFDGLWWHSYEFHKDSNYHMNKTVACNKKGIQLLHIFEEEWRNTTKRIIIQDIILKAISSSRIKVIHANHCIIRKIDIHVADNFLKNNDIHGGTSKGIAYGVYFKNKSYDIHYPLTVFVIEKVNKRRSNIIRYAELNGTRILGLIAKFTNYYHLNNPSRKLYVSLDLRYFNGKDFLGAGYKFVSVTKPNYYFFNINKYDTLVRYPSGYLNRKNLKKKYPNLYRDELSIDEILEKTEYRRIYDCGNLILCK